MEKELTKTITTEKGEDQFRIRLLQDEGVGLLTTRTEENYLILDSLDYWYDLIQNEYPKKKKCSCKNEYFSVQFIYIPREGTDDFREVRIMITCTNCKKVSTPVSIDIDYSPTDELLEKPIIFCEKPKIKYKFSELTSYWTYANLKDFLEFVFKELRLHAYCWFYQKTDDKRKFEKVSLEKAIQIITINHRYLNFYFSAEELNASKYIKLNDDKGVYINDGIWRRDEIIQLSSPTVILGYGVLYYISFCNQYLDKGVITDKSKNFETITSQLKSWLTRNFITKRGRNCFDGKEAYEKFIAKRNERK